MTETGIETVAGFVSEDHQAFFLQFRPEGLPRAHMVYLPSFGEEMNRCRSLVAKQARWFARQGLSCSILDFYGTGESQGELTDATLPIWRDNIDDLFENLLRYEERPIHIWGCRLGALLALDYLIRRPGAANKLLLWQPVASGSAFVTQLLRQRTASLMKNSEKAETTTDMKLRLAAGDCLDVAGYRLGGKLISAINQLEISSMFDGRTVGDDLEIFWLEQTAEEAVLLGPKSTRAIESLQHSGAHVVVNTFIGDPVWQLHKRGACDDLLVKTRKLCL